MKSDPKIFFRELDYYLRYYGNEFKPNQGLEEIIKVVKKYSKNGKWLDLGGGSNTPFWRMFFPKLKSILCADINHEAFLLSELIVNEFIESPCYKQARHMFGIVENENADITIQYQKADLLSEEITFDLCFDNVTQFGLLGLLKDENEFVYKTNEILKCLDVDGVYIGVNWIFSPSYQQKMGFSNGYICKSLISKVETGSYKVIYYSEEEIKNDPNYEKCIIYVIKNFENAINDIQYNNN